AACDRLGWQVTSKPEQIMGTSNTILVASTDTTKKAKHARSMGWTIMSYDEFAGHLHMNGIMELDGVRLDGQSYAAQRRREQEEAARRVEEKRQARQREKEALESNELWGAWG